MWDLMWATPESAFVVYAILGVIVFGIVRWASREPGARREKHTAGEGLTEQKG